MKNILSCLFLLTACTVFGQSRFKPVFQQYNAEVSPVSQINFLRFFATEQLSFSPRTFRIVKELMDTEKNNNYVLTSQGGWVKEGKKELYWFN